MFHSDNLVGTITVSKPVAHATLNRGNRNFATLIIRKIASEKE